MSVMQTWLEWTPKCSFIACDSYVICKCEGAVLTQWLCSFQADNIAVIPLCMFLCMYKTCDKTALWTIVTLQSILYHMTNSWQLLIRLRPHFKYTLTMYTMQLRSLPAQPDGSSFSVKAIQTSVSEFSDESLSRELLYPNALSSFNITIKILVCLFVKTWKTTKETEQHYITQYSLNSFCDAFNMNNMFSVGFVWNVFAMEMMENSKMI